MTWTVKELYEVIMGFNAYTNGIEENEDVVTSSFSFFFSLVCVVSVFDGGNMVFFTF